VRVNDPQTGHHNSDIPVTPSDVERIEILTGDPALYGTGAGIVNIVTRRPEKKEFSGNLFFLRDNTSDASISYAGGNKNRFSNFSLSRKASKVFFEDREYSVLNAFGKSGLHAVTGEWRLEVSAQAKEFGAYDFYTPGWNMPSWEKTQTQFAGLTNEYKKAENTYKSRVYFRRMLDRNKPGWYENNHLTHIYGARFDSIRPLSGDGKILWGFEENKSVISGNALGEHSFNSAGGFPEVVLTKNKKLLLLSYFDDILTKDIEKRYKIKKDELLRTLARFYLTNIARPITFNSIRKFLDTATVTVKKFSSYMEEANLIFL